MPAARRAEPDFNENWLPQAGPQTALFECNAREIFFGGARGGGKTDGVLGKWGNKALTYGVGFNAIMFRQTMPSQDDAWERAHQIYDPVGAQFNESTKSIRFPTGGRIRFRPLERITDADKYQGQNVSDVWVEEAGVYPDPRPIDRLHGVLRSALGVPTQMILTGNPGGAGQFWVRQRYVDPWPGGGKILRRPLSNGAVHEYVFIPSRIRDNKILLAGDPEYIDRLHLSGSAELVRAWVDGDWNAVEGAFFDCWSDAKHIIRAELIPPDWPRFRSYDWGSASPFSVGWWAICPDHYRWPLDESGRPTHSGVWIPRGALVRYREWYGASGPGVGLKMTNDAIASGILERDCSDKIGYSVADPSIFKSDGGPSIAEQMIRHGVSFRPADNRRLPGVGAISGWTEVRGRLMGEYHDLSGCERPMIYFFHTCIETIKQLPALQHDLDKPEDVNTKSEDHCFVAGTMVDTQLGPVAIESLIVGKHAVWSAGWRWDYNPRMTQAMASTIDLAFSNGVKISCTPDHKFLDFTGEWRYAKDLLNREVACDQSLSARRVRSSTGGGFTAAVITIKEMGSDFIAQFGNTTIAPSQREHTSTIRMAIDRTMTPKIWNALRSRNTFPIGTGSNPEFGVVGPSTLPELRPLSGMGPRPDGNGTATITTSILPRSWLNAFRRSVSTAGRIISSMQPKWLGASFVVITAEPVRCVSVVEGCEKPVYCLTEPATQAFTIEGGIVVHNCADEVRYACMSRPYAARPTPIPEPRWEYAGQSDGTIQSSLSIREMIERRSRNRELD